MRLLVGLILVLLFIDSNAALVDRGNGLIYDDVLNITWLQDANYAETSGFESQFGGQVNFQDTQDLLIILNNSMHLGGTMWRLPNMDIDNDGQFVNCAVANESLCRDNELGYMFWQNEVTGNEPAPFLNLVDEQYWASTIDPNSTDGHLVLDFNSGGQGGLDVNNFEFFWAVHDGDIGAVIPIPAAIWLFGSALGALGWFRIRAYLYLKFLLLTVGKCLLSAQKRSLNLSKLFMIVLVFLCQEYTYSHNNNA